MEKLKEIASKYGNHIVVAVIVAVVAYQTALISQLKAQIALNERVTAQEVANYNQGVNLAQINYLINKAQEDAKASTEKTGDINPSNPLARPTSEQPK